MSDIEPESSNGNGNESASTQLEISSKKKRLTPLKERYPWIQDINELYYCKVCTINPTLIRNLCNRNKEEFFVNKGVPKNSDPGRKAESHNRQNSHSQFEDYAKIVGGERKSIIDGMIESAIVERAIKEADRNIFVKKQMRAAYWLFKQEISHTTNYVRLLDLLCLHDQELCHISQTCPANATYRSTSTITEFLELMSKVLDQNTSTLLRGAITLFDGWTLMADETTLFGQSLLGIYARFIHPDSFEPIEKMIHCIPIDSIYSYRYFQYY